MSITTAAARAAVRAANAAAKQVTLIMLDGTGRTGTARWASPGDQTCRTLYLFRTPSYLGPYTVPANSPGVQTAPTRDDSVPAIIPTSEAEYYTSRGLPVLPPLPRLDQGAVIVSDDYARTHGIPYGSQPPFTTRIFDLKDIAGIATTASNSPLLIPFPDGPETNDADTTLGTVTSTYYDVVAGQNATVRNPDPNWQLGTGLE